MKQLCLVVLISAVFLSPQCLAVKPGFKTALTSKGLDYIHQVGLPLLEQFLGSVTIPDISGHADISIGIKIGVDYKLSNIVMKDLSIPSSSLSTTKSGIEVKAGDVASSVTADWEYRESGWPHASDHGSADISVEEVTMAITVEVGADGSGHPTVSTTGCSFSVGKLGVHFHGGLSWLYNLFDGFIASDLKRQLDKQVCQQVVKVIDTTASKALESLPVVIKLDDLIEINYQLLQPPVFTTQLVETEHKGEFFSVTDPLEAPYTPPPLPSPSKADKMLYIWLTDYTANTAGFVFQEAGVLHFTVTPDMVPSWVPIKLNTTSFKFLLPQLYQKFPNMEMILDLHSVRPPLLSVSPRGANFTGAGDIAVYVLNATKRTLAFTLSALLSADVNVSVVSRNSQEVVTGNASFIGASISLKNSNIGNFTVNVLQDLVNLLCKHGILPLLNHYGNAGFPIPILDGVSLKSTTLTYGEGYVEIGTDVNYNAAVLMRE